MSIPEPVARMAMFLLGMYLRNIPIRKGKAFLWDWVERVAKAHPRAVRARLVSIGDGSRMLVDVGGAVQRRIYFLGEWAPAETFLIRSLLRDGDVFVDVGANIGYFSVLGARWVGPTGRVLSCEPSPSTRVRLAKNLDINGCSNVTVIGAALSDRSGTVMLHEHDRNPGESSLRELGERESHTVDVESVLLDDVLSEKLAVRCRLIKMDIEGAELLALHGMRRLLCRSGAPDLLVEVTDGFLRGLGGSEVALLEYLRDCGYRAYQLSDRSLIPVHSCGAGVEQYMGYFTKSRVFPVGFRGADA